MITLPSKVDPEFSEESPVAFHLNSLSGTLTESLVKGMPDNTECDALTDVVFEQLADGRVVHLLGQCETIMEILIRRGAVARPVLDPFVLVKVRDVAGEVAIHQFESLRIGVNIRERAPLVEFVPRNDFFRYIAVGVTAGLRPEPMQGQMPGIPSSVLSALLLLAVGFAEGVLPAEYQQFRFSALICI